MRTGVQGNASMEMGCALAEEVVRVFGEVRLRVFGTSMAPSLLPGDLVSIQRASIEDVSPGEIVLFLQKGRLFVHRVVQRNAPDAGMGFGESRLITRGDRLLHEDPPVSASELLGRVVGIERDNRKIELPAHGSNPLMARALQSSDRATYLYLRLASLCRNLFPRRDKCRS
jgi:signal peptidase I